MLQPDHIAAVPKFGDWDESDPASVDRFTNIFNKLREERLKGTGKVAAEALGNPDYEDLKQHKNGTFKVCWIILLTVSISLHENGNIKPAYLDL